MSLQTKDIMGTMYENFVTRDVTYAGAGALMVLSIYHAFFGCVNVLLAEIVTKPIAFLIFLAVSYFSGLIVKEGIARILGIKYGDWKLKDWSQKLQLYAFIFEKWGIDGLKRVERIIYFLHVGISFGIGSLISFASFLFRGIKSSHSDDYAVCVVLLIVCIFCIIIYRAKFEEHEQIVNYFLVSMQSPADKQAS